MLATLRQSWDKAEVRDLPETGLNSKGNSFLPTVISKGSSKQGSEFLAESSQSHEVYHQSLSVYQPTLCQAMPAHLDARGEGCVFGGGGGWWQPQSSWAKGNMSILSFWEGRTQAQGGRQYCWGLIRDLELVKAVWRSMVFEALEIWICHCHWHPEFARSYHFLTLTLVKVTPPSWPIEKAQWDPPSRGGVKQRSHPHLAYQEGRSALGRSVGLAVVNWGRSIQTLCVSEVEGGAVHFAKGMGLKWLLKGLDNDKKEVKEVKS